MPEEAVCGLCGLPMPKGEEMFRYHGYSGPCPTPPKPKPPTTIPPTIGRVVLFKAYQNDNYPGAGDGFQAAIVCRVWSDTCVNLCVFDANGNSHSYTSVLLVQPGGDEPASGYCRWMDYQLGQAAKTEEVQKYLASVTKAQKG